MEAFISGLMAGLFVCLPVGIACYVLGMAQRHIRSGWDAPEPTNGLHVLNEVKAVVKPKPLERYQREIVQVFIDMDKEGTMW